MKIHYMKIYLVPIAFLLLLITSCEKFQFSSEDELTPVTLKLAWYHNAEFLGFYTAQSQGFYAMEGLDVIIEQKRPADNNNLSKLAEGVYDFSVGGAVYRAQAEGAEVTVIAAIYQFGPDAFFARADSGIVRPADLAGHTIAVKSFGWQKMLEALLVHAGLAVEDIRTVEVGWDMSAFFNGDVDVWAGYLTNEVIQARQQGMELVVLPLYEYGIATIAQTVATSRHHIDTNPDLVERFLRASLRGWTWAIDHPEEAVEKMLELYPDIQEKRDFHLAAFDASIPLILRPGTRIGTIDCEAWNARDIFNNLPSTEGLCTTRFLETVWKDLEDESK